MDIDIVFKKRRGGVQPTAMTPHNPPFSQRYGAWGRVVGVHSENNSVDVYLDTGVYLKQIPVTSKEWVVSGGEYTTGTRNLPPEDARVFVLMPYGNFDGCFVLCSGFVPTDAAQKSAFMDADAAAIRRRVLPGNWKEEYHYATGTLEIVSPDEKTSCTIDYGTEGAAKEQPELHLKLFENIALDVKADDSAKITVFDTELTIRKGEVSLKPKKMTVEVDGDVTVQTNGEAAFKATGSGLVEVGNAVSTLGAFLNEVLSALKKLYTDGSPVHHTASVWAESSITPLVEKLKKIFKQ